MNVFGSNHNEIGSLSENLVLNTAGKIKIRFGNKFIDLLDNQGKIAVNASQSNSPINYTGEQDVGLPAVGSEISDPEKLLIPDIRWVMDYCQQLEAKISELEQNISNNSNS